jgi:aspartate carbamoyltransferase catalytic subunit
MSNTNYKLLSSVFKHKSLVHLSHLSADEIFYVFDEAKKLQKLSQQRNGEKKSSVALCGQAALLFFENSTRTRLSFESACYRLGLGPILIDAQSGTSLNKGETQEDTVLNVAALDPKLIIIRCSDRLDLDQISQEINIPIINAGWGAKGHPTQALLDLFTIWKERPLPGTKLLIVGDILHSRVASSHFEIFNKLGVEIAGCGPEGFRPYTTHPNMKWFDSLLPALEWGDVVMTLRVQSERHSTTFEIGDYFTNYGINKERMRHLKENALLMHPGPVNWGVELAPEVAKDPRTRILQQVNNGVFVRTELLKLILDI